VLSDKYQDRIQNMAQLIKQMNSTMDWVHKAGGDTAIQRHRSRGKMLPRERIDSLIDPGSPFLELSPLAGKDMYGTTKRVLQLLAARVAESPLHTLGSKPFPQAVCS
jgi:acetyl-CoA carboxylase carboxyltransferase component